MCARTGSARFSTVDTCCLLRWRRFWGAAAFCLLLFRLCVASGPQSKSPKQHTFEHWLTGWTFDIPQHLAAYENSTGRSVCVLTYRTETVSTYVFEWWPVHKAGHNLCLSLFAAHSVDLMRTTTICQFCQSTCVSVFAQPLWPSFYILSFFTQFSSQISRCWMNRENESRLHKATK